MVSQATKVSRPVSIAKKEQSKNILTVGRCCASLCLNAVVGKCVRRAHARGLHFVYIFRLGRITLKEGAYELTLVQFD